MYIGRVVSTFVCREDRTGGAGGGRKMRDGSGGNGRGGSTCGGTIVRRRDSGTHSTLRTVVVVIESQGKSLDEID
jgi:hypothetical protein